MNRITSICLLLGTILLLAFQNGRPTPQDLIKRSEDALRGKSSYAEMTITTVRPKWTREMTAKSWALGEEYSLILITGPARDKGNVFLKREKEIWNWISKIERTIKLPPSAMGQSWMGTDLTNDDLVRESSTINDFDHKYLNDTNVSNQDCWTLQLIPHEDAPIIWGKVVMAIDKKDYFQLETRFYDEDMELVNVMKASDIRTWGSTRLPSKFTMIPMDKKGHRTEITYQNFELNKNLKEDFFTLQNMKRVK